jgi:FkbM family methyltransferase
MAGPVHNFLNKALPAGLRCRLRRLSINLIPSMRHLDMEWRLRHLARQGFNPGVILDVGAGGGDWARLSHAIWPGARIYGFEPNEHEQSNLAQAKRDIPGFETFRCFLGPSQGEVTYTEQDRQTSLFEKSAGAANAKAPMHVLDDLIASGKVPPPDFIKLDVQGFELEVLKGGEQAMQHAQGLLLEVSFFELFPGVPTFEQVCEFMTRRGFMMHDVMGILRRPSDDALFQMDVFFLRRGHAFRQGSWP